VARQCHERRCRQSDGVAADPSNKTGTRPFIFFARGRSYESLRDDDMMPLYAIVRCLEIVSVKLWCGVAAIRKCCDIARRSRSSGGCRLKTRGCPVNELQQRNPFLNNRLMRKDMEHYKGLLNGCAPGTHSKAIKLMLEVGMPKDAVLDLGAGSGALLQRLRDNGFTDLHAADLAESNYGLKDIPYTRVDLNSDFSQSFDRKFNVICISEVIEHLDSPRSTLVQIRNLLADHGWLVLTTPNVGFWEGRIKFLLSGELWGFGESAYRGIRHISPLTIHQLRLMLQEIGFEVVATETAGSFATPLRWVLLSPLWIPISLVGGSKAFGECIVLLARKAKPDTSLGRPTAYAAAWDHRVA
jgi:2-polyprenyl-3-methyl-5-hydroxy-6-metoxy-1,4-benzoquinol methylase